MYFPWCAEQPDNDLPDEIGTPREGNPTVPNLKVIRFLEYQIFESGWRKICFNNSTAVPGASNWHWSVKSGQEQGILIPEAFLTANVIERNESPANLKPNCNCTLSRERYYGFRVAYVRLVMRIRCLFGLLSAGRSRWATLAGKLRARVSAEIQLPLCYCCDESEAGDCMQLLANELPIKHGLRIVIDATKDKGAVPSYA